MLAKPNKTAVDCCLDICLSYGNIDFVESNINRRNHCVASILHQSSAWNKVCNIQDIPLPNRSDYKPDCHKVWVLLPFGEGYVYSKDIDFLNELKEFEATFYGQWIRETEARKYIMEFILQNISKVEYIDDVYIGSRLHKAFLEEIEYIEYRLKNKFELPSLNFPVSTDIGYYTEALEHLNYLDSQFYLYASCYRQDADKQYRKLRKATLKAMVNVDVFILVVNTEIVKRNTKGRAR